MKPDVATRGLQFAHDGYAHCGNRVENATNHPERAKPAGSRSPDHHYGAGDQTSPSSPSTTASDDRGAVAAARPRCPTRDLYFYTGLTDGGTNYDFYLCGVNDYWPCDDIVYTYSY